MSEQQPPEGKNKGGRPKKDWEPLFQEWLASGMPKNEFLRSRGINPKSGNAYNGTKDWAARVKGVAEVVQVAAAQVARQGTVKAIVDNVVPLSKEAAAPHVGMNLQGVHPAAQPTGWQLIQKWRQEQAVEDYRSADTIRAHIKIILRNSLVKKVETDPATGQVRESFVTSLRPVDAKTLSQALADVQRIQRLALGLSTENVGVNDPALAAAAAGVTKSEGVTDDGVPVFVVEMNQGGRFVRQRPRQERGKA